MYQDDDEDDDNIELLRRRAEVLRRRRERHKALLEYLRSPRALPIKRAASGKYWIDAIKVSPDVPWWGPYGSRQEAIEDRDSFLRNNHYILEADGFPIVTKDT